MIIPGLILLIVSTRLLLYFIIKENRTLLVGISKCKIFDCQYLIPTKFQLLIAGFQKNLKLAPNQATKIVDGIEQVVAIDTIQKDDLIRVKPGEKIPVDGSIKEGEAVIDESMISGEPIPVERETGDAVSSGTINGNKSFVMIAEKVGSETLLAKIIEMVNTASRSKTPIQKNGR